MHHVLGKLGGRLDRLIGRFGFSRPQRVSSAASSITLSSNGEQVSYTLPPSRKPNRQSTLQFSIPKCGTVMSTGIVRLLAKQEGVKFVSLESELRSRDERQLPAAAQGLFLPSGYCYGGFTSYPLNFDIPIISRCRSILIVRDPRDMLVSLYYSMKYSHPLLEGTSQRHRTDFHAGRQYANEADIDSFVVAVAPTARTWFSSYARVLDLPTLKVFRYEDVVYRKRQWVEQICDHFGWSVGRSKRDEIADSFDVFPNNEERNSHVRQVHPGNFKQKLRQDTVDRIEAELVEEMRIFGYHARATAVSNVSGTKVVS